MLDSLTFSYLKYVAQWGKSHIDVHDFNARLQNFIATHQFIEEVNEAGKNWIAGHNQFSDWHHAEYKQMLGYVKGEGVASPKVQIFEETNALEVNWVDAGAVTPVKNQGSCGSCWAFSTTGSLEGAHFVATGELLSFSEQQLVSCAGLNYGNYGCYGGLASQAYNYYEAGHKAELESVYPYASGTGQMFTCTYDESSTTSVSVADYTAVTADSPSQMKAALVQQPLAVAIEADQMVFQTYSSGVLTSDAGCGYNLDHAVLAVGYGTDSSGQDYWLIKNSWDTTWGDQGYIKLGMDSTKGACGVQMEPEFPTTN